MWKRTETFVWSGSNFEIPIVEIFSSDGRKISWEKERYLKLESSWNHYCIRKVNRQSQMIKNLSITYFIWNKWEGTGGVDTLFCHVYFTWHKSSAKTVGLKFKSSFVSIMTILLKLSPNNILAHLYNTEYTQEYHFTISGEYSMRCD